MDIIKTCYKLSDGTFCDTLPPLAFGYCEYVMIQAKVGHYLYNPYTSQFVFYAVIPKTDLAFWQVV